MIPATGYRATYKHEQPDGLRPYYTHLPVVAWDDEGRPLVYGGKKFRRLVPADTFTDFHNVAENPTNNLVGVIPVTGWQLAYDTGEEQFTEPVVGFGIDADGDASPISINAGGSGEWHHYGLPDEARLVRPGDEPFPATGIPFCPWCGKHSVELLVDGHDVRECEQRYRDAEIADAQSVIQEAIEDAQADGVPVDAAGWRSPSGAL